MKKYFLFLVLVSVTLFFSYCSSTKKAAGDTNVEAPKLNYASNVETLVQAHCSPCHIPAKGGRMKPLDTYASLKENIDWVIQRIELNPTDKGFMPFKKTQKLSDSTINIFKQWKTDGMLEK